MTRKDIYLTEFLLTKTGNPSLHKDKLNIDDIEFNQPDFGYNVELPTVMSEVEDFRGAGWRKFMDCVS